MIFLKPLPELLDAAHVPPSLSRSMWCQYDGAPSHYGIHFSKKYLNVTLKRRWIACSASVHWTFRSLDLSCMDLFIWEHMKSWRYETLFPSVEDLITGTSVTYGRIRDKSRIFQNETGSMIRSYAPYLETMILLVLLAWLVEGGVASLRQGSMG
ncbi:hypothetical protein TNCV_1952841 [Trichonephila clavipes]|nr:hypothetical protein TNCV_1952841 [Trichonephila clavipes]